VCALKKNLRIKVSGLSCVSIFINNDPVHFILIAFKGKPRLSLELNKIPFMHEKCDMSYFIENINELFIELLDNVICDVMLFMMQ
jgi:hypothetical protein